HHRPAAALRHRRPLPISRRRRQERESPPVAAEGPLASRKPPGGNVAAWRALVRCAGFEHPCCALARTRAVRCASEPPGKKGSLTLHGSGLPGKTARPVPRATE